MTQAEQLEQMSDEIERKALEDIYSALDEIDDDPGSRTPDVVLIGEGGLESLAFVNFAVTLEARLQRSGWVVSVIDLAAQDTDGCTTGQLAARIAGAVR